MESFVPTPALILSAHDIDDSYARFIEGRITHEIGYQECMARFEPRKTHFELVETLKVSIPKAFRDDFAARKKIVIDLLNSQINEFRGCTIFDPHLDITDEDSENYSKNFRAFFKLSDGSKLAVKLQFRIP